MNNKSQRSLGFVVTGICYWVFLTRFFVDIWGDFSMMLVMNKRLMNRGIIILMKINNLYLLRGMLKFCRELFSAGLKRKDFMAMFSYNKNRIYFVL